MKNITILLLVFAAQFSFAQSTDKVVDQYLSAMGGKSKLEGVKSMIASVEINTMGADMQGKVWYKDPNKQYSEITVMGSRIVSGFDGEKGWMINPMTGSSAPIDMTDDQIADSRKKGLRDMMLDLDGYQTEMIGDKSLNGQTYTAIAFTDKSTQTKVVKYFDPKTHLLAYDETENGILGKVYVHYNDYKDINGLKIAAQLDSYVDGNFETPMMSMKLTDIKLNEKIDDSRFKKPGVN
ncbi:LolA family protein [Robertkochia solimangrovi]|uniref:LolA family protein n=1 Tax=Robertkochia solimangrovi TaxID=2213046 RepID=UPI00117FCD5B|nr:hypothetical protein [Robertkochia solimangrovi]TRZ42784.1 hypothetical protein DMZ48_11980 [Robertkochia solimangrovi]